MVMPDGEEGAGKAVIRPGGIAVRVKGHGVAAVFPTGAAAARWQAKRAQVGYIVRLDELGGVGGRRDGLSGCVGWGWRVLGDGRCCWQRWRVQDDGRWAGRGERFNPCGRLFAAAG